MYQTPARERLPSARTVAPVVLDTRPVADKEGWGPGTSARGPCQVYFIAMARWSGRSTWSTTYWSTISWLIWLSRVMAPTYVSPGSRLP